LEVRDRKEVLEEARETRAGEKLGKL
jgi:hypothetical protein